MDHILSDHETYLKKCIELLEYNNRLQKESLWADVFNNTICCSSWFLNQSISPGRWAAGYPFLYALYRVLNEFKPKDILELGLGQTTSMITQYAASEPEVRHVVIEHDTEWIGFFTRGHFMADNTEIIHLPIRTDARLKDDEEVVSYQNFQETIGSRKFNLICVDGPFGYMAKKYSRIDILPLLPECLKDSFVIFLDDSERNGEKNTINEMKTILNESNIPYYTMEYKGEKNTFVCTSEDLRFFCSL